MGGGWRQAGSGAVRLADGLSIPVLAIMCVDWRTQSLAEQEWHSYPSTGSLAELVVLVRVFRVRCVPSIMLTMFLTCIAAAASPGACHLLPTCLPAPYDDGGQPGPVSHPGQAQSHAPRRQQQQAGAPPQWWGADSHCCLLSWSWPPASPASCRDSSRDSSCEKGKDATLHAPTDRMQWTYLPYTKEMEGACRLQRLCPDLPTYLPNCCCWCGQVYQDIAHPLLSLIHTSDDPSIQRSAQQLLMQLVSGREHVHLFARHPSHP